MRAEDNSSVREFVFTQSAELVCELKKKIETAAKIAIENKGQAVIAFSGGSTPRPLLSELVNSNIDWSSVVVTLVDERCVPETDALSNAAMLKSTLLNHLSPAPEFVPLYHDADTVDEMKALVLQRYCEVTKCDAENFRLPDIVILGMGDDGHTASFFPDAEDISELVDPDSSSQLQNCLSAASSVERITWSLPYLLGAELLVLHFTGATKQSVYRQALLATDATELPVRSVIHQNKTPLQVYYAEN